jgi:hypothetical protein
MMGKKIYLKRQQKEINGDYIQAGQTCLKVVGTRLV